MDSWVPQASKKSLAQVLRLRANAPPHPDLGWEGAPQGSLGRSLRAQQQRLRCSDFFQQVPEEVGGTLHGCAIRQTACGFLRHGNPV